MSQGVAERKTLWESLGIRVGRRQLTRSARWGLVGFFVGTVLCLGFLVVQTSAFARAYSDRILPGTVIAGVDVGGMTEQQALEAVQAAVEPQLDRTITLIHADRRWHTTPRTLGVTGDAAAVLSDALARSEGVGWGDWFRMRWLGQDLDFRRDVAMVPDQPAVQALADQIVAELNVPARDAWIDFSSGELQLRPEQVGRAVASSATSQDLVAALAHGRDVVTVQSLEIRPSVTTAAFDKVLVLRQSQHRLYLYQHGQRTHDWLVATGTGGYPTPTGQFEIAEKRYLPTWINPDPSGWGKDLPAKIGPGLDNPLGVRALNWSGAGGIRFHGTSNISSLGRNASHGCVRLSNEDVIQLYDLVDVGTKIVSLR
jgi:lipoprotein-anchoring transpeptidase ErfK/SrfK